MKSNMLPRIEIETGGTSGYVSLFGVQPAALRFRINGHPFSFEGTSAERYAMERDLEDARNCIEAARNFIRKPSNE